MRLPTLLLLVLSSAALSASTADAQMRRRVMYQVPSYWTYPSQTVYYSTAVPSVNGSAAVISTSPATTIVNGQPVIQSSGTVTTSQPVYYQYPVTYSYPSGYSYSPTTTYYPSTSYYWPSTNSSPVYYDNSWRNMLYRSVVTGRWRW